MKNVCLLLYTVAVQLFPVRGICLNWNATKDIIFLKCHVYSHVGLKSELLLKDSYDQIRVKCSMYESPYCVAKLESDVVFEDAFNNEFELVLKTTKKNAKGDWKCFHGGEKANVHIDISKDIVHSADIHLSGEVNAHSKITLTCYSCLVPDTQSAYFLVNNVLEDVVRLHDGKCYRKRKLCSQTECTCSIEGNYFTWSFTSDSSYLEFSCEMRFKDEETSQLSIHTAKLYYNETEFYPKMKSIRNIPVSDKNIHVHIDGGTDNANFIYIGIVALITTVSTNLILLGIGFGCTLLYKITGLENIFGGTKTTKEQKMTELTSFSQLICGNCGEYSVCAVCIDCHNVYCNVCCIGHTILKTNHRVFNMIVPNVATNHENIVCCKCYKKKPERLCLTCYSTWCESCQESNNNVPCHGTEMVIIYKGNPRIDSQSCEENLSYENDLSIEKEDETYPIRICGISYLDDSRLVLVDRNNRNLIVFESFESEKGKIRKHLGDEPRGVTAMTGPNIALTFPFQMEIRIYKIEDERIFNLRSISLNSIDLNNLKPFSIAFHDDVFAVEVGEGDDGMIIILADTTIKKIHNKNFAFFTGNTIRLALEVKTRNPLEGHVYISALSKNAVCCVDFQENIRWKTFLPSPRGIIVVPSECFLGNRLVICSRQCNAILVLNKDNGKDKEVLLGASKIKLPRYLSYNTKKRLLCIQVSKKDDIDELKVFSL